MKVLGGLPPDDVDTFTLLRDFWQQMLFKWGFPPWLIEYVTGSHFNWTKVIRYLMNAIASGISTPLTADYRAEILRRTEH